LEVLGEGFVGDSDLVVYRSPLKVGETCIDCSESNQAR
jgi:hypothetical protein